MLKIGIEFVKYKGFFKPKRVFISGIYNVKSIKFYQKFNGLVVGGVPMNGAVETFLLIEYGEHETLLYNITNPIIKYDCERLNAGWRI